MKIYSVSTKHYFAFDALVSEDLSLKIKCSLSNVCWVLPDSYLDVKNKDYGGEPFIQGQTVPYDPKYHEEWLRNYNISKRSCRLSRTNDTSRNYYTRVVPNQIFQNSAQRRDMPPMNNNSYVQNAPPMLNHNIGGVQPSSPACVYPNQMPASQGIYAPTRPGYQGNGHNYPAVNPNGPGYQGNGQGYQGCSNYQQHTTYQSGPNYPPRRPSYQAGGQGAGGHGYQSALPNYRQGGQGVGISSYQLPSSGYQYGQGVGPINVPGKD